MTASTAAPHSHQLLPTVFETRAKLNPNGIFAKFPVSSTSYEAGFRSITHHEALSAINYVAWALEKSFGKGKNFETVAYIGPNDPRYHIVLIAGIKAGYKEAQLSLLTRLKCTKLICTSPEAPAVSMILKDYEMQKLHIPSLQELITFQNVENYPFEKTFDEERNNPIFVLHTSGSTGIPKPLTYTHEYVTRVINLNLLSPPKGFRILDALCRSGSFYISLPSFHIAGVGFSLLIPTFFDCVPVYPLPAGPPTIESFIGAVRNGDFDWAFLPPVVIDDLSRDPALLELAASKLKYLYYVGGSLPQSSGDIVCKKVPIYQALGSSECSIFPLLRHSEDQTFADWNYMQIHPSIQAEFQNRFEDLHELVVVKKKDSQYLQPVFAHFPELERYETRDLFSPHPTKPGLWKHRSRIDDVIVFINGEKTNPVSFEQEVASHPEIRSALVAGQQRFEASLLVEPNDSKPLDPEGQKHLIDKIWQVVKSANTKCPAHARVSKSKILLTDPKIPIIRAGKGTVMRQATLTAYQEKLDDLYSAASKTDLNSAVDVNDHEAVTPTVRKLVEFVTGWDQLENSDDFFSLGMDSLQVLQLIRELKVKFAKESLTPGTVYTNPSVDLLATALGNSLAKTNGTKVDLQATRRRAISELRHKYEREIDSLVESDSGVSKSTGRQASVPCVILLTGSTGALGSYILQSLLLDESVMHIYCLNRSRDSKSLQESRNAERQLPANFPSSRVTFLTCDLSLPGFGIDQSIYDRLLSTTTNIIHNAWPVNFNQALSSFQPSLDGVFGLIAFSTHAKLSPAILFLSSISSAINYRNTPGTEPIIPETVISDDSSPAAMGYGESKYVAERMIEYAAQKLHLTAGIVRVGQIAGTAHNPRGWNRNEWLPSLVLSSRYIGAVPDSLGPKGSNSSGVMSNINWVPIDQLAGIIIELAVQLSNNTSSSSAHVYHAVNPHPIGWESLLSTVKTSLEDTLSVEPVSVADEIKIISLPDWIERLQGTSIAVTGSGVSEVSADVVYRNPGIKLLDFYESLLASDESAPSCSFDIRKTLEVSQSLKGLEPIRQEWMAGWVKDWVASLK